MFKYVSFFIILSIVLCSTVFATEPNAPVIEQQARLDAEMDVARDAKPFQWDLAVFSVGFSRSVRLSPTRRQSPQRTLWENHQSISSLTQRRINPQCD